MQSIKSLYVHFPFCETKCHYCDFYSIGAKQTGVTDPDRFEAALTREAQLRAPLLAPTLDTIFFGGGTPSMTDPLSMERALAPLDLNSRTAKTEWTMEANPSSIRLDRLKGYRALGVNRISMGVQSLTDETLKKMGRAHNAGEAFRAMETVFESGISNVSIDLLCGVPGQTVDTLVQELEKMTSFPITHLSCYLLTLPKTHWLAKEMPGEEEQIRQLLLLDEVLTSKGFRHYEISNFAKLGFEARHNLAYWKGHSYLGLGPSAHSFDRATQTRFKNVSSLHSYSDRLSKGELPLDFEETLTPEQGRLEEWMLSLRLDEGFPVAWLRSPMQQARANELMAKHLLEPHPADSSRLRLTAKGFPVSDQVILTLSDSIPY